MYPEAAVRRVPWGRWTPARLLVAGAILGFGPVVLDAAVVLASNLAILQGVESPVPYWLALLDAALTGIAAPVGLFLALCGILLYVRATRPMGRSRAFRAGFGGAGLNLAATLQLGVLNVALYLIPPELFTLEFLHNVVLVFFLSAVAAGAGLLVAFVGLAALMREPAVAGSGPPHVRIRTPRGKSIYRGAPSAR